MCFEFRQQQQWHVHGFRGTARSLAQRTGERRLAATSAAVGSTTGNDGKAVAQCGRRLALSELREQVQHRLIIAGMERSLHRVGEHWWRRRHPLRLHMCKQRRGSQQVACLGTNRQRLVVHIPTRDNTLLLHLLDGFQRACHVLHSSVAPHNRREGCLARVDARLLHAKHHSVGGVWVPCRGTHTQR